MFRELKLQQDRLAKRNRTLLSNVLTSVFRELKLQQDRLAKRNPDTAELIY